MRTYFIERIHIFWAFLLLLGLICSFSGLSAKIKYAHAVDLENLSPENCKEGAYVAGPIHSCVRKKLNSVVYSGESVSHFGLPQSCSLYTVPIKGGRYICIMVTDKDTQDALYEMANGNETPIPFVGKIVKTSNGVGINFPWYQSIENFDIGKLEQTYEVQQIRLEGKYETGYFGLLLLCICVVMLLSGSLKDLS